MKPPVVVYIKTERAISQALNEALKDAKQKPRLDHRPKHKADPMAVARSWLGERLVEVPGKGYFVDRRPASLDQVMQAANRQLKSAGIEQITTKLAWRV